MFVLHKGAYMPLELSCHYIDWSSLSHMSAFLACHAFCYCCRDGPFLPSCLHATPIIRELERDEYGILVAATPSRHYLTKVTKRCLPPPLRHVVTRPRRPVVWASLHDHAMLSELPPCPPDPCFYVAECWRYIPRKYITPGDILRFIFKTPRSEGCCSWYNMPLMST